MSVFPLLCQVNGYNVTHSTHDDVVDIVRRSGPTLTLKVITPLIKPKNVSTTIIEQLTPISSPNRSKKSIHHHDSPRSSEKHPSSSREATDRQEGAAGRGETRPRLLDSPIMGRIERSGWDSSQEDTNTGFPSQPLPYPLPTNVSSSTTNPNRSPFHVPTAQSSVKESLGIKAYPIVDSDLQPSPAFSQPIAGLVQERNGLSYYSIEKATSQPAPVLPQQLSAGLPTERSTHSYSVSSAHPSERSTLPRFPPRDYPSMLEAAEVTDLSVDSEEDSESLFTKQIKARKDTLQRQSKHGRQRANTLPITSQTDKLSGSSSTRHDPERGMLVDRETVIGNGEVDRGQKIEEGKEGGEKGGEMEEEESLSQDGDQRPLTEFERELMEARESRSRRMTSNQPRMTSASPEKEEDKGAAASLSYNPIAQAVLKKIDSVWLDKSRDHSDSDNDFSSPNASPQSHPKGADSKLSLPPPAPAKTPPPAPVKTPLPVRSKPSTRARADSNPESGPGSNATPSSSNTNDEVNSWVVRLRSTPKPERKFPRSTEDSEDAKEHLVDWRSGLKPISQGKSGSLPQLTMPEVESSKSESVTTPTGTRKQRQAPPVSPKTPRAHTVKAFEAITSSLEVVHSKNHLPPLTSTGDVSRSDQETVVLAVNDDTWTQAGETSDFEVCYSHSSSAEDGVLLPPAEFHHGDPHDELAGDDALPLFAGEIPPPLLPLDGSVSTTSFDLPPPLDDFDAVDEVVEGETCEDNLIPPPIIPPSDFLDSEEPQSPLPPPLPQSSPPASLPTSSQSFTFITSAEPPSCADVERPNLPSPVPSPPKPSSSNTAPDGDSSFEHPSPPPAFVEVAAGESHSREECKLVHRAELPPPLPSDPPPPLNFDEDESIRPVQPQPPGELDFKQSLTAEEQYLSSSAGPPRPPPPNSSDDQLEVDNLTSQRYGNNIIYVCIGI